MSLFQSGGLGVERDEIRARLDAAYAARVAGDVAKVQELCAPGAQFEVAGAKSLIRAYPAAGAMAMRPAVEEIVKLVSMTKAELLSVVIDGHKAAVHLRATVAFGGQEPFETELCHLWEFDDEGQVRSVTEFLDTARLAQEMLALQ
jgi:ketosteroid isomerase-like protein